MSTHRALDRGLMIRGHLAQMKQPVTASGSHQATATSTCQLLESPNENADFPKLALLGFCAYSCGLVVTISLSELLSSSSSYYGNEQHLFLKGT